jgi:hypothetical protein
MALFGRKKAPQYATLVFGGKLVAAPCSGTPWSSRFTIFHVQARKAVANK